MSVLSETEYISVVGVVVKKVFMRGIVLFIVSCDVIERGLRLKPTQAQSLLGREGTAPSTCQRPVSSCRPSSPFSLLTRRCHAVEPTNYETLTQDIANNQLRTKASNPPTTLPTLTLCGGAAIKVLYAKKSNGGRNQR